MALDESALSELVVALRTGDGGVVARRAALRHRRRGTTVPVRVDRSLPASDTLVKMPGDATPIATVIIPALNAAATLAEQLQALASQDAAFEWELLVVDNGSSDETLEVAERFCRVIRHMQILHCASKGANAARNVGAAAARSELLLFCDADDVVMPSWVQEMVSALATYAAVGGQLDNDVFPPIFMPRHPPGLPVSANFLPRAITANFGVRRAVWSAIGRFSEAYEYGCTDTEFCWRLQLAGFELGYAPGAVVGYRHRSTLSSAIKKSFLTGKATVRLYKDFRTRGMPRTRPVGVIFCWLRLLLTSPKALVSTRFRWTWARELSGSAGRIAGSLELRVWYL